MEVAGKIPIVIVGNKVDLRLDSVETMDIENIRYSAPYDLSGGQQQRVAIASILTLDPDIIILDESPPTLTTDSYNEWDLKHNQQKNAVYLLKQPVKELATGNPNDATLVIDESSNLAYSNFARSYVYFDTSTLPISLSYYYYDICERIHNFLIQDDYLLIGNNTGEQNAIDTGILIKKAKERQLNIQFTLVNFQDYDLNIVKANATTAISDYVNELKLGEGIAQSDIIAVVEAVEGVNYVDFTNGIFDLDGNNLNTSLSVSKVEYIRLGTLNILP